MRRQGILVLVLALAGTAQARFRMPTEAPVERLAANLEAYVQEHPRDAQGHYVLARVHSLALIHKSRSIRVYEPRKGGLPGVDHQFHGSARDGGPEPDVGELRAHLDAALRHFARAIALDPRQALFHLGLAYTLEAGAGIARRCPPPSEEKRPRDPKLDAEMERCIRLLGSAEGDARADALRRLEANRAWLMRHLDDHLEQQDAEVRRGLDALVRWLWTEEALEAYARAFELARDADARLEYLPLRGLGELVSHEAAESYLRLLGDASVEGERAQRVERMREHLRKLKSLRRNAITPIIVPLGRIHSLASLVEPRRTVRFDLDGDGRVERWSWISPQAGLLVWDPGGTGRITSGRQLFGSVTWWMFWPDGYRALDALDDDRDGMLNGAELEGIALWRDANGDGKSDAGEVRPLAAWGIVALATRPTGRACGGPMHQRGAVLANGATLPTYDWIARSNE